MAKVISPKEVEETIQKGDWVVFVSAPWCGPCAAMEKSLKALMDRFSDTNSVYVSVEDRGQSMIDTPISHIRGFPSAILFKDGIVQSTEINNLFRAQQLLQRFSKISNKKEDEEK